MSQATRDKLQIVVIDCPMKYLDNPFVRDLFAKVAQLKVEGFKSVESKYFAFGMQDLIATHVMAGEFNGQGEFIPLIGYKALSEETCEYWGIPFDGLEVIEQTGSKEHIDAVKNYIADLKKEGKKIGYQSSLALSPRVNDRDMSVELVKIVQSMGARYITDFDVDASLCIARVKEGSPRLLHRFGYRGVSKDGETLAAARFPQYINDEFLIMALDTVSDEGWKQIDLFKRHWEQRIEISERVSNPLQKDNARRLDARRIAS